MLSASARALFFFTATCVVNAWTTLQPSAYHRRRGVRVRAGDDDLDGGGGINWLPPIKSTPDEEKSTPESQVLPLFPLGEVVYLPNTEHVLSIFEPRYRAMYNDILFSGGRSFATCMVNSKTGCFAKTAMVFYLNELKEVSEQTQDQVKYVCKHKTTRRVKLKKVLNPRAWKDASTYLKVEDEDIEDIDADDATPDEDKLVRDTFRGVMELQGELKEEPRFSNEILTMFSGDSLTQDHIWTLTNVWQTLPSERINVVQKKGSDQIEAKLMKYITQRGKVSPKVGQANLPETLQLKIPPLKNQFPKKNKGKEGKQTPGPFPGKCAKKKAPKKPPFKFCDKP
eukprot:FR738703.1.p1 GENE.FR738703.1~~FR738703.1.p1  ORF type:complete len:363 (+),score=90.47 FR738703.1:72-1091(+)